MSQFRRVAGPLLLLLLPVILGGLTTSSCKADIRVALEPDPRVFTLFAGLLAGGYGGLDVATLDPTQQNILNALADLDSAQRESWKGLLAGPQAGSPPPEFALTDHVLQGGPPPDFAGPEADPGSSSLQRSLQCFWASHAQTLYDKMLEAHATMGAPLASTAQDTVKQALAYARIGKSPFDSLQVIPNPLACQGFSRSWLDPETRTAYVVLGPEDGDLTLALARETFRIILDDSLLRKLETAGRLESLSGVFEWSRAWPFGQDRCGTERRECDRSRY